MVNKRTKELNNFLRNSVKVRASLEKQLARDDFFSIAIRISCATKWPFKFLFHRTGALATSKISLNRLSSAQRKLLSYNCSILSNKIVSKLKCKYYGERISVTAHNLQFDAYACRISRMLVLFFTYRLSYGSRNPKGIFITGCKALLKFAIGNYSFKETLQIEIAQLSHFHFRSHHGRTLQIIFTFDSFSTHTLPKLLLSSSYVYTLILS